MCSIADSIGFFVSTSYVRFIYNSFTIHETQMRGANKSNSSQVLVSQEGCITFEGEPAKNIAVDECAPPPNSGALVPRSSKYPAGLVISETSSSLVGGEDLCLIILEVSHSFRNISKCCLYNKIKML